MILEYFFGNNKKNLIKKINNIIDDLIIEYEKDKNIKKIIQEFDSRVINITNDEILNNNMRELLKNKIYDKYNNIKEIIVNVDDYYSNNQSSVIFVWYYNNKYYLSRCKNNFYNFNLYHEQKKTYLVQLYNACNKNSEQYLINKYHKLFGYNKIVNLLN